MEDRGTETSETGQPTALTPDQSKRLLRLEEYFSRHSPLAPEYQRYIKLTDRVRDLEVSTDKTVGERISEVGLKLQLWSSKTPEAQYVQIARLALMGAIGAAALFTYIEGQQAWAAATAIPSKVADLAGAAVSFDPKLIDLGKLLPQLFPPRAPDPAGAFNPMFSAHKKGVGIAVQVLNAKIGDAIRFGAGTIVEGTATIMGVMANPFKEVKVNSSTIVPSFGRVIDSVGRLLNMSERGGRFVASQAGKLTDKR